MARIGVIICTYNKKEYVVKCIASLLRQTWKDFDILVVDNASSDGTGPKILKRYGSKVSMEILPENRGGTGGFNAGMRRMMGKGYEFLLLLDNDVVLKEDCTEQLVAAMEHNPEIGIQGCKILKMDLPDIIQEFGPMINMNSVAFDVCYRGEKDSLPLPDLRDCDYVPACALIVRTSLVKKIGFLPEKNFIYYDDIEWCMRCREAGYRVAANNQAKVWHKGGAEVDTTTFSVYYLNRNKTDFFMRYLPVGHDSTDEAKEKAIRQQAEIILEDMFQGLYVCRRWGLMSVFQTRMDAFLDALEGTTGRAEDYKIVPREKIGSPFSEAFSKIHRVSLRMNGLWESTREVVFALHNLARSQGRDISIALMDGTGLEGKSLLGIPIANTLPEKTEDCGMVLDVCRHVYSLENVQQDRNYVDGWKNVLMNEDDFHHYWKFREEYPLFRNLFRKRLLAEMYKRNGFVYADFD